MPNKKTTHFSTTERLCECIVVVNIVCHMHVYRGMGTRCTVYASTMDQSNGTQKINIQGQNLPTKDQPWAYGDTCNACTKEQSYRDTRYLCVQRTLDWMHK